MFTAGVLICLLSAFARVFFWQSTVPLRAVKYLNPEELHVSPETTKIGQKELSVFCQRATDLTILNIFQTKRLHIQMPSGGNFIEFVAGTAREVYEEHALAMHNSDAYSLIMLEEKGYHYIPLTAQTHVCVGIYTDQPHVVAFETTDCDCERLVQFCLGLLLWLVTPFMAGSPISLHCCAAALGAHVASLGIFAILKPNGNHWGLDYYRVTLSLAFHQRPLLVIAVLIGGAWIFKSIFQQWLCKCKGLYHIHQGLLKILAYWLIFSAFDNRKLGWTCVCLMLSLPVLRRLIPSFRSQVVALPVNEQEFPAQVGHDMRNRPQVDGSGDNLSAGIRHRVKRTLQRSVSSYI